MVIGLTIIGAVLAMGTAAHGAGGTLFGSGYLGTVAPGASVTVTGDGFKPGSTVTLTFESTPIVLTTVVADASGKFTTQVNIPAGAAAGDHNIVATGVDPSGNPHIQTTLLLVGGTGPLPFTGENVQTLLAFAAAALLLGAVAWRGARRSRADGAERHTHETV